MFQTKNAFVIHCMYILVFHWEHLASPAWKTDVVKNFHLLTLILKKNPKKTQQTFQRRNKGLFILN